MFVGTTKCLRLLPRMEVAGYWVVDHEYSVFYRSIAEIQPGFDIGAMWLEIDEAAYGVVKDRVKRGSRQIFEVKFVGTMSAAPGYYGNGVFKRGALMERVEEIREVPSD